MKKAIFEMGESSVKLPMPVYIVMGRQSPGQKKGRDRWEAVSIMY